MEGRRDRTRTSAYESRTKHPTYSNVVKWVRFVFLLLDESDYLLHPLGDWESAGHQSWVWHYNPDRTKVYKVALQGPAPSTIWSLLERAPEGGVLPSRRELCQHTQT